MIIHENLIQGTPEWHKVRSGKFTASTFVDLFAKETTQAYQNAINDVVFSRISGEVIEGYSNDIMKRGNELEPEARQAYEIETFTKVRQVGFIELNEWVGGSPDGLVGDNGAIEIKCPKHTTLIEYLLTGKIISKYHWQMQGILWISGREWCDYFPYHPSIKNTIKRVFRNEDDIKLLESKINEVIEIAQERIERLTK